MFRAEDQAASRLGAIVSLGGFVFGYDAVVISGVSGAVVAQFGLTDWQMGWIVSAPTLSAMFASLAAGYFSDRFGRRTMLRVVAALYVVSSLLSAMADSFYALVMARAIGGLAFSSLVIAPVYLAEIAPAHSRGRIVSMNQLAIVLGLSAAYFSNLGFQTLSQSGAAWIEAIGLHQEAWRWMLGAELLPATLWLVAMLTVTPESPRWLILHGRAREADRVLRKLHGAEHAAQILDRIARLIRVPDDAAKSGLLSLLSPKVRLALVFGLIVAIAQQITGVNAIYFYAPTVFQQTGVGTDASFLQASLVGLTNVVFTVTAMLLVDRIGRRPLLLLGLAGVAISMTLVAYTFSQASYILTAESMAVADSRLAALDLGGVVGQRFETDVEMKSVLIAALGDDVYRQYQAELLRAAIDMNTGLILTGILLFVASFAVSLGPVTWVFLSEIFPNHIRGTAIALVAFVNGAVSFNVQLVFPVELATFGAAVTFLIYGIAAAVFFTLVAVFVPETRGRKLEALETL